LKGEGNERQRDSRTEGTNETRIDGRIDRTRERVLIKRRGRDVMLDPLCDEFNEREID
jgi:hypothetical protein